MHYRLYSLHPDTGAITAGIDLAAADDAEARAQLAAAVEHKPGRYELWCGTRRVESAGEADGMA